jgi:hypothetical protein
MSRAPLVLSAAGLFCTFALLSLVDEKSAIASAAAKNNVVAVQKSAAKQQEREYRLYRHYRGYDETPSAMIVPSPRA